MPSLIHGDVRLYAFAPAIPPANENVPIDAFGNGGWTPAPNGSTIGFGDGGASRLTGCFTKADFTFFQTLVDIPVGTTLTTFTIDFSGMDDGSRITLFNSANPGGLVVPGSYVFLSGGGTTNLAPYVVIGEVNRVVITQVDDCAVGNQLKTANVVLNGTVVTPPPPPPPVSPPTFSLPFNTPAGGCICTPLLMNTDINGKQSWWVKAQGGPLTITAVAHAVNGADPERVEARVFGPSGEIDTDPVNPGVNPLVAAYPALTPGGTEISDAVVVAAVAGDVYRVEVSTPPPTVGTQPHYRLKFHGSDAVGTHSPSSPSFEHEPVTWYFNVGDSESLNLRVSVAGTPAGNPPATGTTLPYTLVDPNGAAVAGTAVATPASDASIVGTSIPGTWALKVHQGVTEHYRLDKTTGADRGIYLGWKSAGEGSLTISAVEGAAAGPLFTHGLTFTVTNADGAVVGGGPSGSGSLTVPKLSAGVYTVTVSSVSPGWTVMTAATMTVNIFCDDASNVEFVIADITPPVIDPDPLQDLVLEATGPSGAVATWTATGADLGRGTVPVTCEPTSGSTFGLTVTTVVCNAVDLAGNPAQPVTFTVTVVDTTPPTGACTPSYNPSTKNVPRASRQNEDGFYVVGGSDTVSPVTITIGTYTLKNGETVKFTQSPGTSGVVFVNNQGREPIRHFRVGPGDPVVTFTDEAGNSTTRTCYVPPIPK